jgi:uncharacterized protein
MIEFRKVSLVLAATYTLVNTENLIASSEEEDYNFAKMSGLFGPSQTSMVKYGPVRESTNAGMSEVMSMLKGILPGMVLTNLPMEEAKNGTLTQERIDFLHDLQSAKEGWQPDMIHTARNLMEGRGCDKDPTEAFKWMKKAADSEGYGTETASHHLAEYIAEGMAPADWDKYKTSEYYLRRASRKGNRYSRSSLAHLLNSGPNTPETAKVRQEAFDIYCALDNEGFLEAAIYKGQMIADGRAGDHGPDYKVKALECVKKAMKDGNLVAKDRYAKFLYIGCGVIKSPENDQQAFKLFKEAAEAGYVEANVGLALCYETGRGCGGLDHKLAYDCSLKAAQIGSPNGLHNLGYYHENGLGCEKDISKAFDYYVKAAQIGHPQAMYFLGNLYKKCLLGKVDLVKATEWYRKSAEAGFADGMLALADLLQRDLKAKNNLAEAIQWIQRAMRVNPEAANAMLGMTYYFGIGVNPDYALAIKSFMLLEDKSDYGRLIAFSYMKLKKYSIASEHLRAYCASGGKVSNFLLRYVELRAEKEAKKSKIGGKKKASNKTARNAAKAAVTQRISESVKSAVNRCNTILERLEEIRGSEGLPAEFNVNKHMFDLRKERDDLQTETAKAKPDNLTLCIDSLVGLTNSIEESLLQAEFEIEEKTTVAVVNLRQAQKKQKDDSFSMDIENRKQNFTRQIKLNAEKLIAEEKLLKQRRQDRPKDLAKVAQFQEAAKVVQAVPVVETISPYAEADIVYKTSADLHEVQENIDLIYKTVMSSTDQNHMFRQLLALQRPGLKCELFNTPAKLAYAGFSQAKLVYQLRLNREYRLLIPLMDDQVVSGEHNDNNAASAKKVSAWKLIGNSIYVDQPHKG